MVKGEKWYEMIAIHARNYLQLQKLRMATDARLRKHRDDGAESEIMTVLIDYRKSLWASEKAALKQAHGILKDLRLWDWCERTKGLGPVGALCLLGFINPYRATSVGRAKSYAGLVPDKRLESGKVGGFNPLAKARILQAAEGVVKAKDPYYYPLFLTKKKYYLVERGYLAYITDPTLCPKYDDCAKRLKAAAVREDRPVKKPPCRGHVNSMAIRWLAEIILSHGLQSMREEEKMDTSMFSTHRGYIPPKATKESFTIMPIMPKTDPDDEAQRGDE